MARLDDAARHVAAASGASGAGVGAAAAAAASVADDSSRGGAGSSEGAVTSPGVDGGHTGTPKVDQSDCQVEAEQSETEQNEAQPHAAEPGELPNTTEPGETASGVTEPGDAASDGAEAGLSEPEWGVSYGFDRDVELPGDAAIADHSGAEPGWGAVGGTGEVREVGPFFDSLDAADAAVDTLQELVADRSVPVADLAAATVRLHQLTCRVQAAHLAALGQTVAANALPEGSPTANAWITASHRLDSSRASKARNNATWLAEHAQVAAALSAGLLGVDHVTVMRTISQANKARREAFADFEPAAIAAAMLTDPAGLREIMNVWAAMVDPDAADDAADEAYERRKVFLDKVWDRWILHGELPEEMGAQLACALNAFMAQLRDSYDTGDGRRVPASARRADALIALIQAAIAAATPAPTHTSTGDATAGDTDSTSDGSDDTSVTDAQLTLNTDDTTPADDDAHNDGDADGPAHPTGDDDITYDSADNGDLDDPNGDDDDSTGDSGNPSGPGFPWGSQITLPPTALARAQVMITVPITTLHTCTHCRSSNDPAAALTHILTGHHHTPLPGTGCNGCTGDAGNVSTRGCPHADALGTDARGTISAALATGATWSVGNGPGTGTLAPTMLRYATCDGDITRLVVGPASRPLDLGRTERVVPLHLRRALEVRDRGCIIPGCDRPASWCHAHHITHWADDGTTEIQNLALICQRHHTELHLGHWHITVHNGTPRATHIPPHKRAQHRRNQRTAQTNRPQTTPRRT